ncbi:wax ester/triacylglycerol synthase family O-acyltransferase [Nocardioides sp. GCM10027113]|uniref:wax ester/triacylglycerol synthase family O-acyltransferase n=1 Tax=unclassified Nocardioides TaxID=2615069 RepID=UPI00361D3813
MELHPVSPVDAIWLNMDRPENLMVIECLVMLDGPVDRARFEDLVQRRIVDRYPVFRRVPAPPRRRFGLPMWRDFPDFTLADHIKEVRLDAPADDHALQEYVASFLATPLRRDRPLWELHIVEGRAEGPAIFARLHHALADGIALTEVLLSLTDETPDADRGDVPEPARGWTVLAREVADSLRRAPRSMRRKLRASKILTTLAVLRQGPAILGKLLLTRTPSTSLGGRASAVKKVVWSDPIPFEEVRSFAKRTGTTINDVLVAALAGSLHRYQTEKDGRAVDLPTMIPVNLRPPGKPLPLLLGNRFALVLLPLPSEAATPQARLAQTKRRMDGIKGSPEAVMTFGMIHGIGLLGRRLSRILVRFFAAKAVGVTTNVPGPREHRYLAGTRINGLLGWVPGSGNQTLGTCIFTYAGTVRVGFKTDAAVIPDPELILEGFHAELDELLGAPEPARTP